VGTDIVVRLTAFILFCLGVQIIWTGASELLGTITLQKAAMFMIPRLNDVRLSST
jgi:multiple antibiotic resistance protein